MITLVMIPLLSAVLHRRAFSSDLIGVHVWRQTQTQSTTISFYEEDFNILNPRRNARAGNDGIFRMEFPLMQWFFACFYKIFGNHLIITRLLTFVIGIGSVAGLYSLLNALFKDRLAAVAGAWAFNFSPVFFYYTVNPLPDNLALCCAIWGLAFFFRWYNNLSSNLLLWSGLFLCLATLVKLPFVLYFSVPFWLGIRGFFKKEKRGRIWRVALFLIPPAAWYTWVIPGWAGNDVVSGILGNRYEAAQIFRYLLDNLVSVLPEMLLNYASVPLFLAGFYFLIARKTYRNPRFSLLAVCGAAVLAYFFYEINLITNVHDYYLFPFLPLLFVLTGYGALHMLTGKIPALARLALLLLALMPLTAWLRMQVRWDAGRPGFNKDWLTYKKELREAVPKEALCVAGNDDSYCIFFYYIDKKGWPFGNNDLDSARMKTMIREGARFLYSDSRATDEKAELRPFLDSLILEKGSVRVFRLSQ